MSPGKIAALLSLLLGCRLGSASVLRAGAPRTGAEVSPPLAFSFVVDAGQGLAQAAAASEKASSNKSAGADPAGAATCSPVCADALDVVVVLGASDRPFVASDAEHARAAVTALLEHFDLGGAAKIGSRFALVDFSRGLAAGATVVTQLSSERKALLSAMEAWKPRFGDAASVSLAEQQGLQSRADLQDLLKGSRASVRRALLVLSPPKEGQGGYSSGAKQTVLLANATGSEDLVKSSAQAPSIPNKEVMSLLNGLCPAVVIDSSLECGRLRWGGQDKSHEKIKSWGSGQSHT